MAAAVISPGSRSTPLALAFAGNDRIESLPVLDERSAGFFALGLARRTGLPVALVCTSGTAAANYLPAVIEARESGLPLIVLTADRPPEMRECASGQTIDQLKLYGTYPRWQIEMALPEATENGLRTIRQTMVQAWRRAISSVPGPVHVNVPFRDPLEPTVLDGGVDCRFIGDGRRFFAHLPPRAAVEGSIRIPRRFLRARGVLIDGPGTLFSPAAHSAAVIRLGRKLGWPILADGISSVRQLGAATDPIVIAYDKMLRDPELRASLRPDRVISFGPLPTSRVLRQWLQDSDTEILFVSNDDRNLDPGHGRSTHVQCRATDLAVPRRSPARSVDWKHQWLEADRRAGRSLTTGLHRAGFPFEGAIVRSISTALRKGSSVFVASSMSIRNVEFFWKRGRGHRLYSNRGANGIDGTLSTAMGIAHGGEETCLLTGDLALLHDSNGLLIGPQLRGSLTIVLINNQGGGIFDTLPVSAYEPPFEALFAMPQKVDFSALAGSCGADYQLIGSDDELRAALRAESKPGIRLLEVLTDRKADAAILRRLLSSHGTASR
jgi:2-succinyl-5-enolpyruvyl-6-hydroxy-3-cyclohexene-1-carboxylate synthase